MLDRILWPPSIEAVRDDGEDHVIYVFWVEKGATAYNLFTSHFISKVSTRRKK